MINNYKMIHMQTNGFNTLAYLQMEFWKWMAYLQEE